MTQPAESQDTQVAGSGTLTLREQPTLEEIRTWPATVSVARAAAAMGVSKSHLGELIRKDKSPVKVVPLGARRRVVTASLLSLLGAA